MATNTKAKKPITTIKKTTNQRTSAVKSGGLSQRSSFFGGKVRRWTAIATFVVVFSGAGSFLLFQSHADSLSDDSNLFGFAMTGGTCLTKGQTVYDTPSAKAISARFTMQSDGNAVLYNEDGKAVWATGTNGTTASKICMQTDGNLVLYGASNQVLRATNTDGLAIAGYSSAKSTYELDFAVVPGADGGTDGLAIKVLSPVPGPQVIAWVSYTRSTIWPWESESLGRGQTLTSANGTYRATLQTDGNFVVYHGNKAIWSSKTNGQTSISAFENSSTKKSMQLINSDGSAAWIAAFNSNFKASSGNYVERLTMQNDGNLAAYLDNGKAVWATGTNGK